VERALTGMQVFERALAAPGQPSTATDERILDAAMELLGAYGVKRTSMDEIARRAGVNRVTVFRRFGSKDAVVEELYIRELRRMFALVGEAAVAAPDPAGSVAEVFVTVMRFSRDHPLIDRVAQMEPQWLIEAMRADSPPLMDLARGFVADRIRSGQRRGAVPERDALQLADVLVRLAVSYILIPTGLVDTGDDDALRAFALAAIAPIITGRSEPR
jgi:AcrR family transcriptional regulator